MIVAMLGGGGGYTDPYGWYVPSEVQMQGNLGTGNSPKHEI